MLPNFKLQNTPGISGTRRLRNSKRKSTSSDHPKNSEKCINSNGNTRGPAPKPPDERLPALLAGMIYHAD